MFNCSEQEPGICNCSLKLLKFYMVLSPFWPSGILALSNGSTSLTSYFDEGKVSQTGVLILTLFTFCSNSSVNMKIRMKVAVQCVIIVVYESYAGSILNACMNPSFPMTRLRMTPSLVQHLLFHFYDSFLNFGKVVRGNGCGLHTINNPASAVNSRSSHSFIFQVFQVFPLWRFNFHIL